MARLTTLFLAGALDGSAQFFSEDVMKGGAGADEIDGGQFGEGGADTVKGGDGIDEGDGGDGNDEIDGGTSADDFNGGAGDDEMRGGGGDDVLKGGPGDDTLYGGDWRQSAFEQMERTKRQQAKRRYRETSPSERLETALKLGQLAAELRSGHRTRSG